jgi:hypothetical protein
MLITKIKLVYNIKSLLVGNSYKQRQFEFNHFVTVYTQAMIHNTENTVKSLFNESLKE